MKAVNYSMLLDYIGFVDGGRNEFVMIVGWTAGGREGNSPPRTKDRAFGQFVPLASISAHSRKSL